MVKIISNGLELKLPRCPHCSIALPRLSFVWGEDLGPLGKSKQRRWTCYKCESCGCVVLTAGGSATDAGQIYRMWPESATVPEELPERARDLLTQAQGSLSAPAGAVLLAASAVDAMLKDKGLKDGSLHDRIKEAASTHLITAEMAAWAHEVRLEANAHRHADENAPMATEDDAKRMLEFASALAQFLYVLPARVARGRQSK